mmetsp:Transcript_4864/g.7464  ORF Transcript_4864/g.7464 Transcript_4864/m.7464 type:complete len:104 (-) Transcript_4864:1021-1332(-)
MMKNLINPPSLGKEGRESYNKAICYQPWTEHTSNITSFYADNSIINADWNYCTAHYESTYAYNVQKKWLRRPNNMRCPVIVCPSHETNRKDKNKTHHNTRSNT